MLLSHKRQSTSICSGDYKSETFLLKLFQILQNNTYSQCIHWSEDGSSIVISNITFLTKKVLPKFFKHNNYASFVRQLNMYNFHKVRNNSKKKENAQIFRHEKFTRDQDWDTILNIKRKIKCELNLDKKSSIPKDDIDKLQHYSDSLRNKLVSKSILEHMIVFLLDKTKETIETQNKLKKEVDELKRKNSFLESQLLKQSTVKKLSAGISLVSQALMKANLKGNNTFKQMIYTILQRKYSSNMSTTSSVTSPTESTPNTNEIHQSESFSIKNDSLDLVNDFCSSSASSYINCDNSENVDANWSKIFNLDFSVDI